MPFFNALELVFAVLRGGHFCLRLNLDVVCANVGNVILKALCDLIRLSKFPLYLRSEEWARTVCYKAAGQAEGRATAAGTGTRHRDTRSGGGDR